MRSADRVVPIDPTSAERQARLRARLGAPIKAYLDPRLRQRLERCAAHRQLTMASLLREALEAYLNEHEPIARGVSPLNRIP